MNKLSEIEKIIEAVFRRGYYHGVSGGKSNDGETKTIRHFIPILKRKFLKKYNSKQLTPEEILNVIDNEIKPEMLMALQKSRYRPAYEAMDPSLVLVRQRKMLENGWSKDSPDFNVNTRMIDNGTQESLEALDNIIRRLTNT